MLEVGGQYLGAGRQYLGAGRQYLGAGRQFREEFPKLIVRPPQVGVTRTSALASLVPRNDEAAIINAGTRIHFLFIRISSSPLGGH